MKYDAFISYRHTPIDMEMAKKVHSGLETYKVPHAVREKTGKRKIERVFRDQEELPIGADLTDNITRAIEESEYLIVICSPNTPGSLWVAKEIETFIRIHDRNHVLAVLVEGEPGESFPKELLIDEEGNPVEPLAADVRGATLRERNNKFKTEILRLAAPILGCSYDDLKQRHRERRIRKIVTMVSVFALIIALAGTAFGLYYADVATKMTTLANEKSRLADEKSKLVDKVTEEYRAKEVNQSKFLAKEAMEALNSGNREDAVLLAMEALPSSEEERPYVPDAEYALSSALYAYECGSSIGMDRLLKHPLTISDMTMSENGNYIITCDANGNVYLWDNESWEMLATVKAEYNEYNYSVTAKAYNADSDYIYIATEGALSRYDFSSKLVSKIEIEGYPIGCYIYPEEKIAFYYTVDELYVIDLNSFSIEGCFTNECEYSLSNTAEYIKEENLFVIANYDMEATKTYVSVFNASTNSFGTIRLARGYIMDMCQTLSGNIAMVESSGDFSEESLAKTIAVELVDPSNLKSAWVYTPELMIMYPHLFSSTIGARTYDEDGVTHEEVVFTAESNALTFDEKTGNLVNQMTLSGSATDVCLRNTKSIAFASFSTGEIDYIDFTTGAVYSDYRIATKMPLSDIIVNNGYLISRVRNSSDVLVMSYHEANDLEKIATLEDYSFTANVSKDGQYMLIRDSFVSNTYRIYDTDGKELYLFDTEESYPVAYGFTEDGICAIAYSDSIYYINPKTGTSECVDYESMGVDDYISYAYFSDNMKYLALASNRELSLIDVEERKVVYSSEYDFMIGSLVVSENGQKIYISPTAADLIEVDVVSGESRTFEDNGLLVSAEMKNKDYLAICPDGQYLAMCCKDGYMRVLDTKASKVITKLMFVAKSRPYIAFTEDSEHIIMQNEDYQIMCYNIRDDKYDNLPDIDMNTLEYVVCDKEDGLLALSDGYSTCLLDMETYSPLGYSPRAVSFLKKDNSFIMIYNNTMYKSYYKDYNALIKEAKRQFPYAELTETERLRYNVD